MIDNGKNFLWVLDGEWTVACGGRECRDSASWEAFRVLPRAGLRGLDLAGWGGGRGSDLGQFWTRAPQDLLMG